MHYGTTLTLLPTFLPYHVGCVSWLHAVTALLAEMFLIICLEDYALSKKSENTMVQLHSQPFVMAGLIVMLHCPSFMMLCNWLIRGENELRYEFYCN